AGLHVSVELPAEVVGPLVAEARRRGVLLDVIERHYASPAGPRVHGLVIGYGSASPTRLGHACRILAGLLAEARRKAERPPPLGSSSGPAQDAIDVRSLP